MDNKRRESLEIAKKTRQHILENDKPLHILLLSCQTICRYLAISDENEWINDELEGYRKKYKTDGEMWDNIPEYRKAKLIFYINKNTPSPMNYGIQNIFAKRPMDEPIAELEELDRHYYVTASYAIDKFNELIRKEANGDEYSYEHNRIKYAEVPSQEIRGAIQGVRQRISKFLDEVILESEYGEIPENIFDEIRNEVDKEFAHLCPNAIEKITVIYEQLSSDKPIVYSEIASVCRKIITDVADTLFPPKKEGLQIGDKTIALDASKSINRILARIKEDIENDSEKRVFSSMFEYVSNFLKSIQNYASKGDHSEFKKSDATRCVVYTYLLLGDILHYYTKNNKIKKTDSKTS